MVWVIHPPNVFHCRFWHEVLQETQLGSKPKTLSSKEGKRVQAQFEADWSRPGIPESSPEGKSLFQPTPSSSPPDKRAPEVEVEEEGRKKRKVDVARLRATQYEKGQKAINALQLDGEQALLQANEVVTKNAEEKVEMSHFFDILDFRMDLLKTILQNKQEEFTKMLLSHAESLSLQPVPEATLKTMLVLSDLRALNSKVLGKEDQADIESIATDVKNMCALHSQIRNAVKSSGRDIENAIRSKNRRAEAAAKKKTSDAAKAQKRQDDAEAAEKTRAIRTAPKGPLLSFDLSKSKAIPVPSFDNFDAFEKGINPEEPGAEPFYIKHVEHLKKLLEDSTAVRSQLVNFGSQFLGTEVCKTTGRAQCPLKGEELQKLTGDALNKIVQHCMVSIPSSLEEGHKKVLHSVLHTALFGFSGTMEYTGVEDKALGQVRYVHQGVRKLLLMSMEDFVNNMPSQPQSINDVMQAWKLVNWEEKLQDESFTANAKAKFVIQTPGSAPALWLVAEVVVNGNPVVGFRRSFLLKEMGGFDPFQKLLSNTSTSKSVLDVASAVLAMQGST